MSIAEPLLSNKKIVLGITGGIAAYKAAELVRQLVRAGALVRVVMTQAAQAFITPLTLQALSGHEVHTQLLDSRAEAGMGHIELARWADLLLVAPASADFLARMAHGLADDLLSALCLATSAPVAVAPAMNQQMWRHAATQANVQLLALRGVHIWGPDEGVQACGDVGPGRMLEAQALAERVDGLFRPPVLAGRKVVITAGPTFEPIDPVRYIGNHSSGKMGYALAEAAQISGAQTVLISGPTHLDAPLGVQMIKVTTALEMLDEALRAAVDADVFIAAAAVADYRPEQVAEQKIKKVPGVSPVLNLVQNPDIVSQVAALEPRPFTVGFAAETEALVPHAQQKRLKKGLDIIVANDVSRAGIGFNSDFNEVTLIDAAGQSVLSVRSKRRLAQDLVEEIARRLAPVADCDA